MNNELLISLQNKVEDLTTTVKDIEKTITALKINDQYKITSNQPIPPGIACKVAYDSSGLIKQGTGLEISDIPQLDIDKINNLKISLDNKTSAKEFEEFKNTITDMIQPTVKSIGEIAGTAIKVNYNSDGRIISSSDLLPSDIPALPISKIEGLIDIVTSIGDKDSSSDNSVPNIKVTPGTYPKVTIDKYGRVISGEKINMNDIPGELILKLNTIESKLIDMPSQQIVSSLRNEITGKVNSNKPIIPGTFTKIKVDSKGLVTYGDKLTIKDLPNISISDIDGLDKIIREKADHKDLISLSDTVSSLSNSLSSIGEISGIKNELNSKANDDDVKKLNSVISQIRHTLDSTINKIPSDMIMNQLTQIQNELSILSGKIIVIEKLLNIK